FFHRTLSLFILQVKLFLSYISGFVKFIKYFQVVNKLLHALVRVGPHFLGPQIFQDSFGLFRVVPEIGLLGNEFFVFYFDDLTIVVKDTSLKPRCALSSLSVVLKSWLWVKNRANILKAGRRRAV